MSGVAIQFQFTAGRYHATAWGHHVNEGQVDWPPSPYRVLRALYAQAHRLPQPPDDKALSKLFGKLSAPPSYHLPAYTSGHSRHYLPTNAAPICVVDGFVVTPRDRPVVVQWDDAQLDEADVVLLNKLASNLSYLGRAEASCTATLCAPRQDALGPGEGEGEPVSLLALARGDSDVIGTLSADTAAMRKAGADVPSGTRWLRYFVAPPATAHRASVATPLDATMALLLLDHPVVPRVLKTIDIAESVRGAMLRRCEDKFHPVLSGHDDKGGKRLGLHLHAHYLPFDFNGDGRVRHLLLWAPEGFDDSSSRVIGGLTGVHLKSEQQRVAIRLLSMGNLASHAHLPIIQTAHSWTSATPFLLSRHPKRRAHGEVDGPEDQLRRELALRGFPEPASIERVDKWRGSRAGRPLRWLEFRRWRKKQSPAVGGAFGFKIHFHQEVSGPIALGFGAHFGMGLFRAVR